MRLFSQCALALSVAVLSASCKPRTYSGNGNVKAVNADTELSSVPEIKKATVALVGFSHDAARQNGEARAYRDFCTGTLVNRQTVVTAGHCLAFSFFASKPDKIFVLFDSKLEDDESKRGQQIKNKLMEVSMRDGISIHPKAVTPSSLGSLATGVMTKKRVEAQEKSLGRRLNADEAIALHRDLKIFDYDIAVVRLPKPAPDTYTPIPIATTTDTFGEEGLSAGYGLAYWFLPGFQMQSEWAQIAASGHQIAGELRVTSGKRAEVLEGKTLFVKHRVCDGTICTMAPGDSGGPYFQKNSSGEFRLVGVLSGPCDLWNNHEVQKIPPLPCTRYQYVPASEEFIRKTQAGN